MLFQNLILFLLAVSPAPLAQAFIATPAPSAFAPAANTAKARLRLSSFAAPSHRCCRSIPRPFTLAARDDDDDDGWGTTNEKEGGDSKRRELESIRSDLEKKRGDSGSTLANGEGEGQERDLFIPVFAVVSLLGLFGSYAYEMARLYSRGELYLP